ncbi:MAG: 4Fe-4S dicluster domain-containing protein [Chloroflexota bacterium]
MVDKTLNLGTTVAIKKEKLLQLILTLTEKGYQPIGPCLKDGVISYEPIVSIDALPQGFSSEQEKGHYRVKPGNHKRYFDITPGPHTWKKFLFPPRTQLFKAHLLNGHWQETLEKEETPRYALIGVRPCESAAIQIQDKVFIREDFSDPIYAKRRENLLIVTVNCLHPSPTCFCTSMNTGPKAQGGFDLSLTELDDVFLVELGSDAGIAVMQQIEWEPASAFLHQIAQQGFKEAEDAIIRQIDNLESVPNMLLSNLEHPYWNEVGQRCMSCTSCTQVCPTCFCWDVEDSTDLNGKYTRRERVWDSCFNLAYSTQAGGNTRPSTKSRYRQWLTHKMGSWVHQFDSLGCVGCGRCVTWCPAKIDITEEIKTFQDVTA